MSADEPRKIVGFPQPEVTPEEHARRLQVKVENLARLDRPPGEWLMYVDDVAKDYNVPLATLKARIETTIKANEKKAKEDKAEDRQQKRDTERRAEKDETRTRREEERARKEQARADKEAAREAERRQKEKDKAFVAIIGLPSAEHEARLAELAKRLDENLELLRDEFAARVALEDDIKRSRDAQPWDEAVDTRAMLTEMLAQLRRYIGFHGPHSAITPDDLAITTALWIMFSWVHDIATHSPNLYPDSADPDSGKSTLLGVLGFLVRRPHKVAELTAASVYRIVDRLHPTLIVDEADTLFRRKPALTEIVNAGWTKGVPIWRPVNGVDRPFDVFCPKVICGKGLAMADTTASRGIRFKMWPKADTEIVEDFDFTDNDSFAVLRRKLARWDADTAAKLKNARPALPTGFRNRLAANWRLLFAIADLAGDDFAKAARAAAIKLSRKRRQLSEGLRLLEALSPLVANLKELPSEAAVLQLTADKTGEWAAFRGHGPITQRQLAALLEPYEVYPDVLLEHRPRARGYFCAEIRAVIARMLPRDPYIRTAKGKKPQ